MSLASLSDKQVHDLVDGLDVPDPGWVALDKVEQDARRHLRKAKAVEQQRQFKQRYGAYRREFNRVLSAPSSYSLKYKVPDRFYLPGGQPWGFDDYQRKQRDHYWSVVEAENRQKSLASGREFVRKVMADIAAKKRVDALYNQRPYKPMPLLYYMYDDPSSDHYKDPLDPARKAQAADYRFFLKHRYRYDNYLLDQKLREFNLARWRIDNPELHARYLRQKNSKRKFY